MCEGVPENKDPSCHERYNRVVARNTDQFKRTVIRRGDADYRSRLLYASAAGLPLVRSFAEHLDPNFGPKRILALYGGGFAAS